MSYQTVHESKIGGDRVAGNDVKEKDTLPDLCYLSIEKCDLERTLKEMRF